MSAQLSPPPAITAICWTSTLPRSCSGERSPRTGIARRERITEPQPVGEGTKSVQPDVGDDTAPTGFHDDATRAGSFHLGSALLGGVTVASTTTVSPARRAFSRIRAGQLTRTRERSELVFPVQSRLKARCRLELTLKDRRQE